MGERSVAYDHGAYIGANQVYVAMVEAYISGQTGGADAEACWDLAREAGRAEIEALDGSRVLRHTEEPTDG